MFMAADRQPKMRAMIMAGDEAGRRAALDELLPLQQGDFEGLFEAMEGWPVTIRLLDPPLHEFLPDRFELHEEIVRARIDRSPRLAFLESRVRASAVARGDQPDARNARRAARGDAPGDLRDAGAGDRARRAAVAERTGRAPHLEIMIPLVAYERELELVRDRVLAVAEEEGLRYGDRLQRRER